MTDEEDILIFMSQKSDKLAMVLEQLLEDLRSCLVEFDQIQFDILFFKQVFDLEV